MARRIDNQFLENFKRNTGLMTVFTEKKDKLDTFIKIMCDYAKWLLLATRYYKLITFITDVSCSLLSYTLFYSIL